MTERERKEKELELLELEEAEASQQPEGLPAAVEADKVGLQDATVADAVAAPFMLADAAGEKGAEKLGEAGFPMTGAVVGTATQMLPYIPAAVSGIKAAPAIGETITNGIKDYLSKAAGKFARKTAVEAIEPTTTNAAQLGEALGGPRGVEKAGQYLLDEKVITPGATAEDMTARLGGLAERSGKHIGEWRDKADFRSLAQDAPRPTALEIERAVREKLAAKYGPGANAAEGGQLDNAINEIRKLSPVDKSTTGAEMAQTMENVGGSADEAYNAARASQEVMPEMTDGFPYLTDKPTFTELAQTSTRLNDAAKGARQINQPSGALTDAANVLSKKSTEGLETFLQPTEQAAFAADKAEFGLTKGLEAITDRTMYRDMTGSTGTTPISRYAWYSQIFHKVMPLSRQASYADKISKALKLNPAAFGKNAQALQRAMQAGKASLNSTIYMLQQQDPDFKEEFEEMNRQ